MKSFNVKIKGENHAIIVLASGSKGNCTIFDNMVIDCAVSFKTIKPYLRFIDFIFISHEHSDHINIETLLSIKSYKPSIKIMANQSVIDFVGIEVNEDLEIQEFKGLKYKYKNMIYDFKPVKLYHSVPNNGLFCSVTHRNGENCTLFYATDTKTLDGIKLPKIDLMLIEVNYQDKVFSENVINAKDEGKYVNWHTLEHLEMFEAYKFIVKFCNPNSFILELHQSSFNRLKNKLLRISYSKVLDYVIANKNNYEI